MVLESELWNCIAAFALTLAPFPSDPHPALPPAPAVATVSRVTLSLTRAANTWLLALA